MGDVEWKQVTGPSAGLVQRHFIEARQEQLYRRNPDLERNIAQIIKDNGLLKQHYKVGGIKIKRGDIKWLDVYSKITKSLQKADFTINFAAEKPSPIGGAPWFLTDNTYTSYTQVYERSIHDGEVVYSASDAKHRVVADDRVTFPTTAPSNQPTQPFRGLRPGRQSQQRVESRMRFGDYEEVTRPGKTGIVSKNPHFDPKTKQVFAALNYGRRPHGCSTYYGSSHLVLSPKFKINALYFAGDTFFLTAQEQFAYHILGAVLHYGKEEMVRDVIQSCYFDNALCDTDKTHLLLEGHIFGTLPFKNNIEKVVLEENTSFVVQRNARKFASRWGAKLVCL
jgi:hypothetical protein